MADLWESWPDAIKEEIEQQNLSGSKVSIPLELVEAALKQGKVAFSWRLLRSWVRPAMQTVAHSVLDGTMLELPLKVIAPAFLSRHHDTNERKRVELAGDIPDLWSGGKAPASDTRVACPRQKVSEETNYYVWNEGDDRPVMQEDQAGSGPASRPTPAPGTSFKSRFSTPNDVVQKAAALEGVAGALVALQDGLLVASKLTPDVSGDTLAAFIPQAFVRVSQTTKELRMGDLNNLNFTLGTTPWKIFRVGSLFFAVYGRPGEPLPTAKLAGIAAELERKPR